MLSSETPDTLRITHKNKIKKAPYTQIIRKQHIKEPVNPRKRAKENTLTYVKTNSPKETPPTFWHKVDYEGDNNQKTHGYEYSPSETEGLQRHLAKENENKENE